MFANLKLTNTKTPLFCVNGVLIASLSEMVIRDCKIPQIELRKLFFAECWFHDVRLIAFHFKFKRKLSAVEIVTLLRLTFSNLYSSPYHSRRNIKAIFRAIPSKKIGTAELGQNNLALYHSSLNTSFGDFFLVVFSQSCMNN